MIVAKVEHFIKDGSREAYIELMKEMSVEIQNYGASAKRLEKMDAADENHLLLEFSSMESFKKWHDSDIHTSIKKRLLELISKQPKSSKFKVL